MIETFGTLAATILPEAPHEPRRVAKLVALTQGANRIIADGRAASGAKVDDLAKAANYATDKHVRDLAHGPWMRTWSALAIRLMLARDASVLVEHVGAAPTRVRRESRFVAYDRHPHCAPVKPLFSLYVSALDRHLLDWQVPFTTGTSCDRYDVAADQGRIAEAEADLEETLCASVAEHLALALTERSHAIDLISAAAETHPERFHEAGLDPRTVLHRCFAELCVLEALPYGAPCEPGELSRGIILPGEEDHLLVAAAASMRGIAYCGQVSNPVDLDSIGRQVNLDPAMTALFGVAVDPWGTSFRTLRDEFVIRTEGNGQGARTDLWRVFGMANDDQQALALAQHAAEEWPRNCIRRAETDAPAGKVYPKGPAFRMALRAMLRVADAARVTAERSRRAEGYGVTS